MSELQNKKLEFVEGQHVALSLAGFDVQAINSLVSNYRDSLLQQGLCFCVMSHEIELLSEELKPVISMLIRRNLFVCVNTTDWQSLFQIADLRKPRFYLVVHDMRSRRAILEAAKAANVFVNFAQIQEDGNICEWVRQDSNSSNRFANEGRNNSPTTDRMNKLSDSFRICSRPGFSHIDHIAVKCTLSENSKITDGEKIYVIKKKQMVSNGATSYSTNIPNIWVKIYDNAVLTSVKRDKIKLMLSKSISSEGICWPISCAYDSDNVFRGYFYQAPSGEPMHLSILKEAGLLSCFPSWTRKELAELLRTILQKIVYLHDRGVIIGSLNPAAIRIVDSKTIYWIDTDTLQVEDYFASDLNLSFRPPEHIGQKVFYATLDSDYFVVAELIFMIMMLGKSPYGEGIISNPEELLRQQRFLYANRENHSSGVLPGANRVMWSHLTQFKDPLYQVLQKGGRNNAIGTRLNDRFWLGIITKYVEALKQPFDPESVKMYPRTFKRHPDMRFVRCDYCGVEHPEFFYRKQTRKFPDTLREFHICDICFDAKSDVSYTCEDCHKVYYYTNETAIYHRRQRAANQDWKKQRHCDDCKRKVLLCSECKKPFPYYQLRDGRCHTCNESWRNTTYRRIYCKDCGNYFDFTNGEREYLQKKGYSDPTRCKNCRDRKKTGNGGYQGSTSSRQYNSGFYTYSDSYNTGSQRNNSSEKKKSWLDKLLGK